MHPTIRIIALFVALVGCWGIMSALGLHRRLTASKNGRHPRCKVYAFEMQAWGGFSLSYRRLEKRYLMGTAAALIGGVIAIYG